MNVFKSIMLYILSIAAAFMAGALGHEIIYRRNEHERHMCDKCHYRHRYYRPDYTKHYYSYTPEEEEE